MVPMSAGRVSNIARSPPTGVNGDEAVVGRTRRLGVPVCRRLGDSKNITLFIMPVFVYPSAPIVQNSSRRCSPCILMPSAHGWPVVDMAINEHGVLTEGRAMERRWVP